MQQETHYLSADGTAGKAVTDDQKDKGAGKDRLSSLQGNHGNRADENTKAARQDGRMLYIIKGGGIVM